MLLLEILILVAILVDIAFAIYAHRKDSGQQEAYRDEELELLNQVVDAIEEGKEHERK